jgi:hypothetical protein
LFKSGVKDFVGSLETKYLIQGLKESNISTKQTLREKLKETFYDKIEEDGLEEFLKKMEIKTLKIYVESLKFQTNAETKEELSKDINEEVIYSGSRNVLTRLTLFDLQKMCKSLSLKKSSSKLNCVNSILQTKYQGIQLDPSSDEEEEVVVEKSPSSKVKSETVKSEKESLVEVNKTKKTPDVNTQEEDEKYANKTKEELMKIRPKIEKGITYLDLQDGYWADELKDFCKENGLGNKGTKPENIRKILKYLDQSASKKRKAEDSGDSKLKKKK